MNINEILFMNTNEILERLRTIIGRYSEREPRQICGYDNTVINNLFSGFVHNMNNTINHFLDEFLYSDTKFETDYYEDGIYIRNTSIYKAENDNRLNINIIYNRINGKVEKIVVFDNEKNTSPNINEILKRMKIITKRCDNITTNERIILDKLSHSLVSTICNTTNHFLDEVKYSRLDINYYKNAIYMKRHCYKDGDDANNKLNISITYNIETNTIDEIIIPNEYIINI